MNPAALVMATGGNPLAMIPNPLEQCRTAAGKDEEEALELIVDDVEIPDGQVETYTLRMCINDATDLPKERSYAYVMIGEGTAKEVKLQGPTADTKTTAPSWEWSFEQEIEVERVAPKLEIHIYGYRMLSDVMLGATAVSLPPVPTKGPRRQVLKLKNVPAPYPGWTPPLSTITIVWQICESTRFQPDLNRVAEMDLADMEAKQHIFEVRAERFSMQTPLLREKDAPPSVIVQMKICRLGEEKNIKEEVKTTPLRLNPVPPKKAGKGASGSKIFFKEGLWTEEQGGFIGWQMSPPWSMNVSRVSLLTHVLDAQLYLFEGGVMAKKPLGTWRECLGDLMETIDQDDKRARFDAKFVTKEGQNLGKLRLSVDIHNGAPHKPAVAKAKAKKAAKATAAPKPKAKAKAKREQLVVIRQSMPNEKDWEEEINYFVTIVVKNMPPFGRIDPYVKVKMGSQTITTSKGKDGQVRSIAWDTPIKLTAQIKDRKAKIEVWNDTSWNILPGSSDELIGEYTLYSVAPDKEEWCHCYGGAFFAPKADQAMQMTQGAIRPPSTYHATAIVHFGTRRKAPASLFAALDAQIHKKRLCVRFHKGYYFESMANRQVNVLVQLPGCVLPDSKEAQKPLSQDAKAEAKAPKKERHDYTKWNRNLLSFPAVVDGMGVLRFCPEKHHQKSMFETMCSRGVEDLSTIAWVQRTTPKDERCALGVMPGMLHAYCYVLPVGDEGLPPPLWFRMRMGEPSQTPKWKKARIDCSVSDSPESTFETDCGGYILGSCWLLDDISPEAAGPGADPNMPAAIADKSAAPSAETALALDEIRMDEVPSLAFVERDLPAQLQGGNLLCSPTMSNVAHHGVEVMHGDAAPENMKKVFCHVDVLAAREIPSTDEDGLCDPCYEVIVGDKKMKYPLKDIPKSLNPNFMHRLVIPIEAEFEENSTEPKEPLPPVMFKLYDLDQVLGGLGGTNWNAVCTVPVKHAPMLKQATPDSAVDVNNLHIAKWYALDKPVSTPFDAALGGIDPTWTANRRPVVLLAVGFGMSEQVVGVDKTSYQTTEDGGFLVKLKTEKNAFFQITLDLLGLRNVTHTMHMPELLISSFWEGGPASLNVHNKPNPNFDEGTIDPNDKSWQDFAKKVAPILKLQNEDDMSDSEDDGADDSSDEDEDEGDADPQTQQEEDKKAIAEVKHLYLDDLMGIRVQAPVYTVPVIPYLQPAEGADMTILNKQGNTDSKHKESFVLLPSILFQLQNCLTRADYGTLSLPLRQIATESGGFNRKTWMEITSKEFAELSDEMRGISVLDKITINENAYTAFVDIFSAKDGYLVWNNDLRQGRCLTEQRLFTILNRPDDLDDDDSGDSDDSEHMPAQPPLSQYFNSSDWMCSDPRFSDEPFDDRVTPTLRCASFNGKAWTSTRGTTEAKKPKGPEELLRSFFKAPHRDAEPKAKAKGKGKPKPKPKPKDGRRPAKSITKPEDLLNIDTKGLYRGLANDGWRCSSHLVAPEPVALDPDADDDPDEPLHLPNADMSPNHHTFLRDVGHVIKSDDRDSRIIARLRVAQPMGRLEDILFALKHQKEKRLDAEDVRELEEAKKDFEEDEQNTLNYLTLKFELNGTVVWVAPEMEDEWREPGCVLLAVLLADGSDTVVPVTVPCFDIRFKFESAWYLRKTLTNRWHTVENKINRKERLDAARAAGKKKSPASKAKAGAPRAAKGDASEGEETEASGAASGKEDKGDDHPVATGYGVPIRVSKDAFICRIRKRKGGLNFDRPQSRNWYFAVLKDVFPEIYALKDQGLDEDPKVVKTDFMGRFMNLHKNLSSGEGDDAEAAGMVKGHVHCREVSEPTTGDGELGQKATFGRRSVECLWKKSVVMMHIYVLTAQELNLGVMGVDVSSFNPYLICKVAGRSEVLITEVVSSLPTTGDSVNFYHMFPVPCELPGASTVKIELWDSNVLADQLIGTMEVDLEDRWLVLERRRFRSCSNPKYLKHTKSPPTRVNCKKAPKTAAVGKAAAGKREWRAPSDVEYNDWEDKEGLKLLPHTPPEGRMPIECKDIINVDDDTGMTQSVGQLRFWMDFSLSEDPYTEASMSIVKTAFEIRFTIWGVTNIQVFADAGERNDMYIKAKLIFTDLQGLTEAKIDKTDTHKWAHNEAWFNWVFKFNVTAPASLCALELCLMDEDAISSNDPIYDPVQLPLDQLLMLANEKVRGNQKPLGVLSEKLVFDSWPGKKPTKPGCCGKCCGCLCACFCCCCRRKKRKKDMNAVLSYDVQILPPDYVASSPIEEGCQSPPKGRMTWFTALQNPVGFTKVLMGPKMWHSVTCSCGVIGCAIVTIIIIIVIFYLVSIKSQLIPA